MAKKRIVTLGFLVFFIVSALFGSLSFLLASNTDIFDEKSSEVRKTAENDFTGSLGENTGASLEIDLTVQATAEAYNNTTRTYYLYALEVVSDLFVVNDAKYLWETMPGADVVAIYSQYANTSKRKFKFYSRIGGRTEAVLKYNIPGRAVADEWGTINFVFIVRNNELAHSSANSPQNNPDVSKRSYSGTATSISFNANTIAVNPTGMTDEFRIMAVSISYPSAVDASSYTMYEIGADIELYTYTGCFSASGFEDIAIKLKTAYYLSFGVEFLVKNISTRYVGLINCYIGESNPNISQNVVKKIEDRTYRFSGITQSNYNMDDGYDNPPISNLVRARSYSADMKSNAYHNLTVNPDDASSYNYATQMAVHNFDVVLQQNQLYNEYVSASAFYYCSSHGKTAKGSSGATHLGQVVGDDQNMCTHDFYRKEVYTGSGYYGSGTTSAVTHDNGPYITCSSSQLLTKTWSVSGGVFFICQHGFIAPSKTAIVHPGPGGTTSCTRSSKAYNSTTTTSACTYNSYSAAVNSTRYINWNTVPFYFQANSTEANYPLSLGTTLSISDSNVYQLSLSTKAGATKLNINNLRTDNGLDTYAEIDRVYAYDRAFFSVGLMKKRNTSYLTIAGLKNTKSSDPKYLVLAVSNIISGKKYTTLVSVRINITNLASGMNANTITRTNAEPIKNPNAPESAFTFSGYRGDQKNLFAERENENSIAYDDDTTDDFYFPSTGNIVFKDALGVTPETAFSITLSNQNHTLTLKAQEVFSGTIYVKVVDVNYGEGLIPITCNISNKAPKLNESALAIIEIASSAYNQTTGVFTPSYRKISTNAVPVPADSDTPYTLYSVASDDDHALGYNDVLTIEAYNVPAAILNNIDISYPAVDAYTYPDGKVAYKSLKLTAKQWTAGATITLRAYDGYSYTSIPCKIVIKNTNVQTLSTSASYIFSGFSGETRTYTGNQLGVDFDNDQIAIISSSLTMIADIGNGYRLATNGTDSFASASVINDTLTITLIAKSKRIYSHTDMNGKGHFFISVKIKDAGDTSQSEGLEIRIGIEVKNTAPQITDKEFTFISNSDTDYEPSSFAFDPDVKEMAFNVDSTSLKPRFADNLLFYSLDVSSDIAEFADIYFLDNNRNKVSSGNYKDYAYLRIHPKKWTKEPKVFYVQMYDMTGTALNGTQASPTKITFQITNTKPVYRDSQAKLGSLTNQYELNLSLENRADAPKEFYIYPYSFVTDADLPQEFDSLGTTVPYGANDSNIYYNVNNVESDTEYEAKLGRPIREVADMDVLLFDTIDPVVRNNSMSYIDELQVVSPQRCYKITAKMRNTGSSPIEIVFTVVDSMGEKISVYLRVNVLNSAPVLKDDAVLNYTMQVVGSGANPPPSSIELRVSDLVDDPDVDATLTPMDSPSFLLTVYALKSKTGGLDNPSNIVEGINVNVSIKMGVQNPGQMILSVVALSRTSSASTPIYIGFQITDNAPNNSARTTDILWIEVVILNSTPSPNTEYLDYSYNATDTPFSHSIMIRTMDLKLRREEGLEEYPANELEGKTDAEKAEMKDGIIEYNNVKYSRNYPGNGATPIMPIILVAIDPDGDNLSIKSGENPLSTFVTANEEFKPSSSTFNETDTTGWFCVVTFTSAGKGKYTFTITDDNQTYVSCTLSIAISAAKITEYYKNTGKVLEIENYQDSPNLSLTAFEPIDLLSLISIKDDPNGYKAHTVSGSEITGLTDHVRLQKSIEITSLPDKSAVYTDLTGGMVQANNVSAVMRKSDTKYLDIMGGGVFEFSSTDESVPAELQGKEDLTQRDEDDNPIFCRYIYLRGKQRTLAPIEVTFSVHVYDSSQQNVYLVGHTPDDEGDEIFSQYVDFDGDGVFDPDIDVFKFTIPIMVLNAQIYTETSASDMGIRLSASTKDAVISTASITATGNQALKLPMTDFDPEDEFLISVASIDAGNFENPDQHPNSIKGVVYNQSAYFDNTNYEVYDEATQITNRYDYKSFFEISYPEEDKQSGGTKYLYITPKKRTTSLPDGYFPLYMMVYDDYQSSSKQFTKEQIIGGNQMVSGLSNIVSRAIVCVKIYIENSMPVATHTTVRAVGSYKDSQELTGFFYLTQLFNDPDMILYSGDSNYFDMNPEEGYDTILSVENTSHSGTGETEATNFVNLTVSPYYRLYGKDGTDLGYNVGHDDWYSGACQKIEYRIKNPVHTSARIVSFVIRFIDSEGASASITIEIEIQNTPPSPVPLPSGGYEFEMYVGQSVVFDVSVAQTDLIQDPDTLKLPATKSLGSILPAHDEERQSFVIVQSLSTQTGANSFVALNRNYLSIKNYQISNPKRFTITATNATPEGVPYEFKFMLSDQDTEFSLSEVSYSITIYSRPPELIKASGVPKSQAIIPIHLGTPIELDLTEYISDADGGDTLQVVSRPAYRDDGEVFRNHANSAYMPYCAPIEQFAGYSDFVIVEGDGNTSATGYFEGAQNSDQNQWIKAESYRYSDKPFLRITALNVYNSSVSSQNAVSSVVFYVADRANMAVEVVFNFVVENDTITSKNASVQDYQLGGAGSSSRISLNDYLKGSAGGGDADFENVNTRYDVSVTDDESGVRFGVFTVENGYIYTAQAGEGEAFRDYFDLAESSGIELGKYLNFVSKKRTELEQVFAITVGVIKPVWSVQNGSPVLNTNQVELRFSLYVENSAPKLKAENIPVLREPLINNVSEVDLTMDESKRTWERALYGSGSGNYLMTDSDLDSVSFDPETDVSITGEGGDEILEQFRNCLDISFDKDTGMLKLTMLSKMHNVDTTPSGESFRPYVTRTVNIQTYDEVGAPGELLSFPVTLRNSTPRVKDGMNTITFNVIDGEYYTTVKNGEKVPYIELIDFIDDADFNSPIETYKFDFQNAEGFGKGMMRVYDKSDSSKPIAEITPSPDNKQLSILGLSLNRRNESESIIFTIEDGSGQSSSPITFKFVVGNKAPYPKNDESEQIVFNILGDDDESNERVVFLNENDHKAYSESVLAVNRYATIPTFTQMFLDDNPNDFFVLNNLVSDVLTESLDNPLVQISSYDLKPKSAFVINTIPNEYGQERIFLTAYDSDPTIYPDALSATIEIVINIAKNPESLEKSDYKIYNGHIRTIKPSDIYNEQDSIGFSFKENSFEFLHNGDPQERVLEPNIKVLENNKIQAVAEGMATIMAVLCIDESEFILNLTIIIEKNNPPEYKTKIIKISKAETTNVDGKYGEILYVYREITEYIEDFEEDELLISEISSNKEVIVDTRVSRDKKSFDLLCHASGRAKITIIVSDAVGKHTFVFEYINEDLDKLSFFAYLYADYKANQAMYIWGVVIAIAIILTTLIIIFTILRKIRMKRALERLLQHELENEQELIMISQGFDPNQGYLAQAGEMFGIDTLNVKKREQLAAKQMQMLDSQKKAFDILQLNATADEKHEKLLELDHGALEHESMEDYLDDKLEEFNKDESSVELEPSIDTAPPLATDKNTGFYDLKADVIDKAKSTNPPPIDQNESVIEQLKQDVYESIDKESIPSTSTDEQDFDIDEQLKDLFGDVDPDA